MRLGVDGVAHYAGRVPGFWKYAMVVLVLCLLASMVIAVVRLATTPTEILGGGFRNYQGPFITR